MRKVPRVQSMFPALRANSSPGRAPVQKANREVRPPVGRACGEEGGDLFRAQRVDLGARLPERADTREWIIAEQPAALGGAHDHPQARTT